MASSECANLTFKAPIGQIVLSGLEGYSAKGDPDDVFPAEVGVHLISLHGSGCFSFFRKDLGTFFADLERAYRQLSGKAVLRSEDQCFQLEIKVTHQDVTMSGVLMPFQELKSKLEFSIDTDQSYLREVVLFVSIMH